MAVDSVGSKSFHASKWNLLPRNARKSFWLSSWIGKVTLSSILTAPNIYRCLFCFSTFILVTFVLEETNTEVHCDREGRRGRRYGLFLAWAHEQNPWESTAFRAWDGPRESTIDTIRRKVWWIQGHASPELCLNPLLLPLCILSVVVILFMLILVITICLLLVPGGSSSAELLYLTAYRTSLQISPISCKYHCIV